MKRFFGKIRRFFYPAPGASRWIKLLPYAVLITLFIVVLISGAYVWDYTNSSEFCGSACHGIHPAENLAYLSSPHAEVKCVECHIGRAFVGNQITRKISDFSHVMAAVLKNYEYPIHVKTLRPAREVCERCHNPDKFSDDSQRAIFHYQPDADNTLISTYLIMKTGGGSIREGLGVGIHWHTQSKVLYYATDEGDQEIPYVVVIDENGFKTEYVNITSGFDPYSVDETELKEMDCITCHNRISHTIYQPEEAVDRALYRGLISPEMPEIRFQAVEVLKAPYESTDKALQAIGALGDYYRDVHPDYYENNWEIVDQAIRVLKEIYTQSVFPEQLVDWNTHPDNLGHAKDPGCFRCHDGKHLRSGGFAIRLECNLCHAIPTITGPEDTVSHLDIDHSPQPSTHRNPNWIALHRFDYDPEDPDETCSHCHDVANFDGPADDSSFCSNSACHGRQWDSVDLAVLDTEDVRKKMLAQLPHYPAHLEPVDWDGEVSLLDEIHRVQEELLCEDCHEPFPPTTPAPNEACIECHGETVEGITELTAIYEPNPHDWHYGDDFPCYICHINFGPVTDPCGFCHVPEAYTLIEGMEPEK